MKKWLLYFACILLIPPVVVVSSALMVPELRMGAGDGRIENHLLGKSILIETEGLYKDIDVEEYVLGVLAGTIPADYDLEALKVQAVLIRTNVLKEMQELNSNDAQDLPFEYLGADARRTLFGERNYERYEGRLEQAVVESAGKVICFEGSLIAAMYHEVSIGKTASAKEILDRDISYLQSADSSRDVEAKNYMNIITYKKKKLRTILDIPNGKLKLSVAESSENGFVKKLKVNDTIYTGEEAMELLGLPSMNFYVEKIEGNYRFVCLGTGNCLGVSQYGANCMAQEGKRMEEIIKHYYKGVQIESAEPDKH